ncbi:hypothetical protein GMW39_00865 [Pectobacterium parmentieri]|uniref:hypothetical protein n=1 Tax=Pectobacterium parmentieri TaxID=1905730 RepID=UPI0013746576|nr:hypothetical protein [Pectobacterium parmentieri]QHQ14560.1 hypothetical protein GMW39_00865 [Pectobacterium parmentieri]
MKDERQRRKEAYIDAVAISYIAPAELKSLHRVSENVIDKYLYVADRYPTFQACYELWIYLNKQSLTVPNNLRKLIGSCDEKAEAAIKKKSAQ